MTNAQYLINALQSISRAGNRFCFYGPGSLALSLPERMMEFCKATLNLWVCGPNPMMWPFKWNLSAFKNLPLASFGSERVKRCKVKFNPALSQIFSKGFMSRYFWYLQLKLRSIYNNTKGRKEGRLIQWWINFSYPWSVIMDRTLNTSSGLKLLYNICEFWRAFYSTESLFFSVLSYFFPK